MAIPFTVEQFHGVFRGYNTAVWPMQWLLVAMALLAVVAVLRPRAWSGVAVSAILGILWAWIAVAYFLCAHQSSGLCVCRPLDRRRSRLHLAGCDSTQACLPVGSWPEGHGRGCVWSAYAGHPYPETPTFGLPCPTTNFTIGALCFAVPPTPRSPLIVPLLWCLIGAQAAFLLGVQPDLGLIAAGLVGIGLLVTAGQGHRTLKS